MDDCYLKKSSIRKLSVDEQKPIVFLVDEIINIKQANPKADTAALERRIDEMVYELYDLTEEEIVIVEGKNK